MQKEFNFTIGADPEFNLEMNNRKIDANAAIQELLKNKTNWREINQGYQLGSAGAIGWDGHSETGEIRPSANQNPTIITENLRKIFTEFNKIAPLFELSTLSRTDPIGGHIHFEFNIASDQKNRNDMRKINAIHKRLTSFYLPIIMGENKVNLAVRLKSSYGKLCNSNGDSYRLEPKFKYPDGRSGYTYELRYPSAEWMTTPKIATATLAYLGVIFHEITKNPKEFEKKCKDIIIRTEDQANAIQTLALVEYKSLTETLFKKIKKLVKTFELYENFKEEIDYILSPEEVLADKQTANYDIRIGWNLLEAKKETSKRIITSKKALENIAKEKDLDIMGKFVKISYNEDMNVKTFAEEIAKRSIAFNWNLNKTYYFFGTRKGIKEYIIIKGSKIIKGLNQCKTELDLEAMTGLISRVMNKTRGIQNNSEYTKINFATGKLEKIKNELIIIGIPYNERLKSPKKSFIELIYNIEKDKIKEETIKPLKDDRDVPNNEKGEIWKIANGIETNNIEIAKRCEVTKNNNNIEQVVMDKEQEEEEETAINN